MPQFETATFASQIFWLAICFSILCLAMRLFIVPRITTSLETREQRLQEDWKQSEILLKTREALKQENLNLLAEAHGKAHSTIHKVLHEIHERKSKRLAALDDELSIKTKNIRIDLENQTNKILQNIEPLVSQAVKATTPRILGQPLAQTEIKKIVLDVLKKPDQV